MGFFETFWVWDRLDIDRVIGGPTPHMAGSITATEAFPSHYGAGCGLLGHHVPSRYWKFPTGMPMTPPELKVWLTPRVRMLLPMVQYSGVAAPLS
jgi:hypothetical protein